MNKEEEGVKGKKKGGRVCEEKEFCLLRWGRMMFATCGDNGLEVSLVTPSLFLV